MICKRQNKCPLCRSPIFPPELIAPKQNEMDRNVSTENDHRGARKACLWGLCVGMTVSGACAGGMAPTLGPHLLGCTLLWPTLGGVVCSMATFGACLEDRV